MYVLAATNRPDMIDPAMCRPGRLDKLLYVDLPSADGRAEIFRTVARKVPFAEGAAGEAEHLVRTEGEGYSGADVSALVREAGVCALRRTLGGLEEMEMNGGEGEEARVEVTAGDFRRALDKVHPSVSVAQRRRYEALRSKFAGLPVRVGKEEEGKRVDGEAGDAVGAI